MVACPVWDLAAVPKPDKALKAQPVQELVFHLSVTQPLELLQHQHTHYEFRRERWPPSQLPARARSRRIDLRRQRGKIYHPSDHLQDIP